MNIEVINIKNYDKEDYIYIGRPSSYGNPYSSKEKSIADNKVDTREESLKLFEEYINKHPELIDKLINEMKEKNIYKLGCYCKPKKCHGDILKEKIDLRKYKSIL
jgi:GTPase involved in cell partitioning and DNA repair